MIDLGINLFQEIAALGGGGGGYSISNSLRFNDNDSAYLSRTPSVAGNRKTWTFSAWVKRGNVGIVTDVLGLYIDGDNQFRFSFNAQDKLDIYDQAGVTAGARLTTTQLFRDVSGWYHIVLTIDTTNASAENRMRLYVNGFEVSAFDTDTQPSLNYDTYINTTNTHNIGLFAAYFDGYMSEVNLIDGQALTADDFGEIDSVTGEWSPKKYSGTYGTNGFYLEFKDGAALGDDTSGNTNDWTPTNLASTDQMLDTPTNNFATLNPIYSTLALSEGSLEGLRNSTTWGLSASTIGASSGKWYAEYYVVTGSADNRHMIGVGTANDLATMLETNNYIGASDETYGYYGKTGDKYNTLLAGNQASYGATYTNGDIIGIALDMDAGTLTFYKNNVSQGVAFTGLTGEMFIGTSMRADPVTHQSVFNFGQDSSFAGNKTRQGNTDANGIGDFYYEPPTGYLALCADNLPEPAIVDSESNFNVVLDTGANIKTTAEALYDSSLVWIKDRANTNNHQLIDTVRGTGVLQSNTTAVETTYSAPSGNSVAWVWKAGGTAVTNNDGSITSQVSANVDAGFSIVSYTGNSTSGATIGHGLNSAPEIVIAKTRTISNSWHVYTKETGADNVLVLDSTAALYTNNAVWWDNTDPNSTVVTLGSGSGTNSSVAMIAYCFHSVESFSKFGSYVGNGSTDGPFIYTGFRPAFVIIKATSISGESWMMFDNKHPGYNETNDFLAANLPNAAFPAGGGGVDMVSNGFKLRSTSGILNTSGATFIYMAFAEAPFKNSVAR